MDLTCRCAGRWGLFRKLGPRWQNRFVWKFCRHNMSQLLHVAVLWLHLLPSLLCVNLVCFYHPIMEKEKMFNPILTECSPNEICFKADGRYGSYTGLSSSGCISAKDCSRVQSMNFKGTAYTMRYACCDWSYCNGCSGILATSLLITVTLVTVALVTGIL